MYYLFRLADLKHSIGILINIFYTLLAKFLEIFVSKILPKKQYFKNVTKQHQKSIGDTGIYLTGRVAHP